MYCGIVSIMEVAPCVGVWMRVNGERLARRKKDSDAGRADCARPIWPARGVCSNGPARRDWDWRLPHYRWRTEVRRYDGHVKHHVNDCPVPPCGTGRYKFKRNVKDAQLKLAATKSKSGPRNIFPQTVKQRGPAAW